MLVRVDLETGRTESQIRSGGRHSASITIAGYHVVKASGGEKGHRVIRSGKDGLKVLGDVWKTSHMDGGTSCLVDGRLYVRGLDAVYCYGLRKR